MAKILIGNIKGPQGEQGPQGVQGPVGPQGPKGDTGPMPTLINNGTTTQAGVGALDAAYGKTLADKDTDLQNQLNTLNGKTEELEEDIAAAEGKIGQIVTIPASQTIMSTFVAQKVGTVRQYTYSVNGVPTDYPQAFKDAGINYCPVMTIGKAAESVGMILIQDAKNANGEPHAIFGYTTTTQTFWGSVL